MSEIAKLEKKIDRQFDELTALMSNFANGVQNKFDQIDARLNSHDKRFDKLDVKFDKLMKLLMVS